MKNLDDLILTDAEIERVPIEDNDVVNKKFVTDIVGVDTLLTTSQTLKGAINEVFNNGVNVKNDVVTHVNTKTLTPVTIGSNWSEIISAIDSIPTNSSIKNTKLNLIAPTTHSELLTNPITLQQLATSVIKYIPGEIGVTEYNSDFNNGDSSNFDFNSNIVFDGTMHLADKTIDENLINNVSLGSGVLWSSNLIDRTLFNTIDSIVVTDSTIPTINVEGTNKPEIVMAKNNINLTGVYQLQQIIWQTAVGGNGFIGLVISINSGSSWKAFDGLSWVDVNILDKSDVKAKCMIPSVVNNLTLTQLNELKGNSNIIKFAYYIEKNNISDISNNDLITLKVNMPGNDVIAPQTDFSYTLESDMQTITYTINTSGTYTFVYADSV